MTGTTVVVDFGATHTVTVAATSSSAGSLVSIDGEPWFPSAVFWGADGSATVGDDAVRLGRAQPARLALRTKVRIAEGEALLADSVVPTVSLVREVLGRALTEADRVVDAPVGHLVLTHPADWGPERLGVLLSAAQGLSPRLSTVTEPVGAAARFAQHHPVPPGASMAVLDLGGGTCDATIVRQASNGFTVTSCAGLPDLGGDDLDQRLISQLRSRNPQLERFLAGVENEGQLPAEEMIQLARFRADVRGAKEILSRHPQADVVLPGGLGETIVTRNEFEDLVRADLQRAVLLLNRCTTESGLAPQDLVAVQLVGGSSRVPLLAQLLQEWTTSPVRLDDQPETVVAFGACTIAAADQPDTGTADTGTADPAIDRNELEPTQPAEPAVSTTGGAAASVTRRRAAVVIAVSSTVLLAAVLGIVYWAESHAVSGTPKLDKREVASLPDPSSGEPFAIPGRTTQELPLVDSGETINFAGGSTNATWRLDKFSDGERVHQRLVDAGNNDNDRYRWILVSATVGARKEADYVDMTTNTYLVDDRGLMISPVSNARLPPECHPEEAHKKLQPGDTATRCLAFSVPENTPITEVAVSLVAPDNPGSPGSELLEEGARVRVDGLRVSGEPRDIAGRVTPLGTWHDVALDDVKARVAVVDVVGEITGYFDEAPFGLPGSRGVLVRMVVKTDQPLSVYFPLDKLFLTDDRGAALSNAQSNPTQSECLDTTDKEEFTGTVTLCKLFVVPTGTRIAAIGIAAPNQPYLWRVP